MAPVAVYKFSGDIHFLSLNRQRLTYFTCTGGEFLSSSLLIKYVHLCVGINTNTSTGLGLYIDSQWARKPKKLCKPQNLLNYFSGSWLFPIIGFSFFVLWSLCIKVIFYLRIIVTCSVYIARNKICSSLGCGICLE